mgnify:FL=1
MVPVDGTAPFSVPAVRCSSPGVRVRQLTSTALTIGFIQTVPVDVCSSPLRFFASTSPNNVGLVCGSVGFLWDFHPIFIFINVQRA